MRWECTGFTNRFMKLATYRDGSRDGQLVVVSKDLRWAHYATGTASRLQQVLDDWAFMAPQLQDLYQQLNAGRLAHAFAFDPAQCMAPLPRAAHCVEAQAYPSHVALTAPQVALPSTEALWRQVSGDHMAAACDEVVLPSAAMGMDFGAGMAAITGALPWASTPEQALWGVRLLVLSNSFCLRQLVPAHGMAWAQPACWPAMGFSPVAVTPDELGDAWRGGRVHLPLHTSYNGRKVGMGEAAQDMAWHWGQLLAQLCQTRALPAGSVVGSGVLSQPAQSSGKGKSQRLDWPAGYHSIAEKRAMEVAQTGEASTPFLQFGDTVRIEMKGKDGQSIFGAVDQTIISAQGEGSAQS